MPFDPTRPSSDRNRARPLTAAEAVVQSEMKSRIMTLKRVPRLGLGMVILGVGGITRVFERQHGRTVADIPVTLPGGHQTMLTFGQVASMVLIPIGAIAAVAGFFLYRRALRDAMANPITAGIFDPSVEWPEEPEAIRLPL
jgi:hypothetical protein